MSDKGGGGAGGDKDKAKDKDLDSGGGGGESYLLSPYWYIRKMPGKQIRSRFAAAFNHWLCIDSNVLDRIMEIVEMLHNSSLMIDDIEDNSILRRSLPVTHSIYGVARTINSANYIYFVALSKCLQLQHPQAIHIFTEQMLELHRGQGKELYWRDLVKCPSEAEYEEMVIQKTGGLLNLVIHLMQLFSGKSYQFDSLIRHLALYFQIRDDYINLCSKTYAEQKSFAEDLTEGKFSFPILYAIRTEDVDDEVLNIIRQRTKDDEVKKYCVQLLYDRKAFQYTLKRLKELYDNILMEVKQLGGNRQFESIMEALNEDIKNDDDLNSGGCEKSHLNCSSQ